jgi:hypothetical protein
MPIYSERVPSQHEWCPECEAYMPWGHKHPASGGRGGGRGAPPTSVGFYEDDDQDPESSVIIMQIYEILDDVNLSRQQTLRAIKMLVSKRR